MFGVSRKWTNWAGNQTARPTEWVSPTSADQVVAVVAQARSTERRVKAVGSGHSFTATAVADDILVDLSRMSGVGVVDAHRGEVDVAAGTTISDLNEALAVQGWALANMGDIAYQTISGAIATSTHGTGSKLTGLAAQVTGLSIVDGRGELRHLVAADGNDFRAAQVGVGALGIVTNVRLKVVPAFVLRAVEAPMRLSSVLAELDELADSNDHFEFYWIPHTGWTLTKRNNRTDESPVPMKRTREWWQKSFLENTAFGALCAVGRRAPGFIPRLAKVLPSSGEVTYSNASHRVFATERRVRFVEMEYAIPREACTEALRSVTKMVEAKGFRVSFPVEVRFTAPDDVMLSTSTRRASSYIAVHMYRGTDFTAYFREVAAIMADYEGRPHWGKMHFLDASRLAPLYPEWDAFLEVRRRFDPEGTFANDYVRRIFGLAD